MNNRLIPAALVLACAAPAAAQAAPVSVQLRIEGRDATIYEGPVTTDGKVVQPSGGEAHTCDGTNNGENPSPGPTPTSALDDGRMLGNYTWAGTWYPSFNDFRVDRVGADTADPNSEFWGLYVNSASATKGGCQLRAKSGDEVLWGLQGFSVNKAAKLSAPNAVTVNSPFTAKVTNGANGAPLAGASVGGATTGADGVASLKFSQRGIYKLKASRADVIRSNGITVCADPAGAAPCTSTDKAAPKVSLKVSKNILATTRGRSRTLLFDWTGTDQGGSGVTGYSVDVEEDGARIAAFRPFITRTALTRVYYRARSGRSYRYRVTAFDRATNRAPYTSAAISVPFDDRDKQVKRSRGWKRLRRSRAWGRTVLRSTRKGAKLKLAFSGRRIVVIGRKLARGGRVAVTVDGKTRVLLLRGATGYRTALFTSRRLGPGRHTATVTALGRNPVEIDALGPLP